MQVHAPLVNEVVVAIDAAIARATQERNEAVNERRLLDVEKWQIKLDRLRDLRNAAELV